MKTKFYLNNRKVSKKAMTEQFGKEAIDKKIKEAKETFMIEPNIWYGHSWWMGSGMLTIDFE